MFWYLMSYKTREKQSGVKSTKPNIPISAKYLPEIRQILISYLFIPFFNAYITWHFDWCLQ